MAPSWHKVGNGPVQGIEWSQWLDCERPVDPYLVWADITNFAAFGGRALSDSHQTLPILVEMTQDELQVPIPWSECSTGPLPRQSCSAEMGLFEISGAYTYQRLDDKNQAVTATRTKFLTARVALCNVGELFRCPATITRFQLGLPRIPAIDRQAGEVKMRPEGLEDAQVVVGIIDDGCPFAAPDLVDQDGRPQVRYLWDQDGNRPRDDVKWFKPHAFGYGAEIRREQLFNALQSANGDPSPLAAFAPYSCVNYLPAQPDPDSYVTVGRPDIPVRAMMTRTHGAAVTLLAAGAKPAYGRLREGHGLVPDGRASEAAAWPVIFVQLPTLTTRDTSGGSLCVHVVDAIMYIVARAAFIPYRSPSLPTQSLDKSTTSVAAGNQGAGGGYPRNHIVINLSYGAVAGPHDGTSILEEAIDEFAKKLSLTVVLSAGNAHGSRTHARLALQGGGDAKRLIWTVGPDNPREAYLEIWLPDRLRGSDEPVRGLSSQFVLTICPPGGGASSCTVGAGKAEQLVDAASGEVIASVIYPRCAAQGKRGTMVLLATRPTARPLLGEEPRPHAPHGDWSIDVKFDCTVPQEWAVVHAWTERNDLISRSPRRQQTMVVGDDPTSEPTENSPTTQEFCRRNPVAYTDDVPKPFQPQLALSSVGGGRPAGDEFWQPGNVVVVGGYRVSDEEMAAYSSGGPARLSPLDNDRLPGGACRPPGGPSREFASTQSERIGPDVDAVSDVGTAVRGVRSAGMMAGIQGRISGTSAAAPGVTRFIVQKKLRPTDDAADSVGKAEKRTDSDRAEARATLTPTSDDRFRRGRYRVRPGNS